MWEVQSRGILCQNAVNKSKTFPEKQMPTKYRYLKILQKYYKDLFVLRYFPPLLPSAYDLKRRAPSWNVFQLLKSELAKQADELAFHPLF